MISFNFVLLNADDQLNWNNGTFSLIYELPSVKKIKIR